MIELKCDEGVVLFTEAELRCKGSGGFRLAPGFAEKLIALRVAFGEPMRVLSCCRSLAYNTKVGGAKSSFHIYDKPAWSTNGTCAIDIATPTAVYRQELFDTAWAMGWSIGAYRNFLHLDRRSDYTPQKQILFKGGV